MLSQLCVIQPKVVVGLETVYFHVPPVTFLRDQDWQADSSCFNAQTLMFTVLLQGDEEAELFKIAGPYKRNCSISCLTKREDFELWTLCNRIIILFVEKEIGLLQEKQNYHVISVTR